MIDHPRREQFLGCLIGQAVGDGLGAPFEGLFEDMVYKLGPPDVIVANPPEETYYTDDTQMAIGVAETLVGCGRIDEATLCAAFVANYDPARGYGSGARRVLGVMGEGGDWRTLARELFPGGSLGNGAAMRAAPVGLMFCDDLDEVAEQARLSALPTHVHPIGIDGARMIALAVALAVREPTFHRATFFQELARRAETEEFRWQMATAARMRPSAALGCFGNSLEAHRSVTTAVAAFASAPDDYSRVIARAIGQGNDTDTLAAMAGAICGARLGIEAIPGNLVAKLEDHRKGREYLLQLAGDLHDAHRRLRPG